jgi:hypothetical protein
MKKAHWFTLMAFILVCSLLVIMMNSKQSHVVPEITLKVGNDDISSTLKSRTLEDPADFEDASLFRAIMNDPAITIPYVKLGETVHISLHPKPKSFEVRESILLTDGDFKYKRQPAQQQPVTLNFNDNENEATFTLNENVFALLSSNSQDYQPSGTIRGFRLVCKWEDRTQEYAFVIKTDAHKPSTAK